MRYRVQEGENNIPNETIERRYFKGLHYLFEYYLPIFDKAVIYDNSNDSPTLIAKQLSDKIMQIQNNEVYNQLINYAKKHYSTQRR